MAPPSSSKKVPDKDLIKRKKTKSKSAKRPRCRDSSISSYSSSDSERGSRRKKSSTKSRKIEKKRKDRKGKSRKKRGRRESSVSSGSGYSSRSCSTCSGSGRSGRSVSPVSRGNKKSKKLGGNEGERGRRTSRPDRYRSRSCSTCSGSRSRSPIKGRVGRIRSPSSIKGRVGGTRGRSPVEGRYSGKGSYFEEKYSGKGSPFEERYSGKGSPFEERYSGKSSPIVERYSGKSSPIEERYIGKGSLIEERYSGKDEKKRLRSVLEVRKSFDEDEDKDETVKDFDDRRNKKRHMEHGDKEKDSYGSHGEDKRRVVKDSVVGNGDSLVCGSKESGAVGDVSGKEASDLEMILRQKALENFRKFRGRVASNKGSSDNKKDETCKVESDQCLKSFFKASESEHTSSIEDQMHVKEAVHSSELKAASVQNVPVEENKGNTVQSISNKSGSSKPIVSSSNSQKNNVKRAEVFPNNLSSEETSLAKDVGKKIVTQTGSGKASETDVEETNRLASRTSMTDNQNLKPNEPTVEVASGSQFEQKTFSRMRDGEVVQVSYKVYIPKKTPALVRRQLQR